LTVNSDLFAVGFLAKITTALAAKGISMNAYSAYHHDHLLVPFERKEEAMEILDKLSKS
ncbi:ACT domain-containing protein, partial [Candidatus Micrarchaeota archaeon]|nr:ACT domain-containing protein [Candidatus Micrarchaeota archaeon]MBU1886102.1 ACT domain-containing protein [Candidatus Micrarchaeota archaeon]